MEPPRDGGTKVCSNGPGHMIKMAAMPIYGKNLKKNLFLPNKKKKKKKKKRQITLRVGMLHRMYEYYQVTSNGDPELTLTYFTARSDLVPYVFLGKKVKQ